MNVIIFIFAVMGMTHIIVDPATIMQPMRDLSEKYLPKWFNELLGCNQCCGTWVGFLMGWILISSDPFVIFACGMAGSWLASWSTWHIAYLGANTVVKIDE